MGRKPGKLQFSAILSGTKSSKDLAKQVVFYPAFESAPSYKLGSNSMDWYERGADLEVAKTIS